MGLLSRLLIAVHFLAHAQFWARAATLTSRYASVANYYGYSSDGLSSSTTSFSRRVVRQTRRRQPPIDEDLFSSAGGSNVILASTVTRQQRRAPRQSRSDANQQRSPKFTKDPFGPDSNTAGASAASLTYRDLSPLGKLVAGTVEIGIATIVEYMTGFMGGYVIGTVTDIPRLLFRSVETGSPEQQLTLWQEVSQRTMRMNNKSFKWAKK
jgi:hypothetical protein